MFILNKNIFFLLLLYYDGLKKKSRKIQKKKTLKCILHRRRFKYNIIFTPNNL